MTTPIEASLEAQWQTLQQHAHQINANIVWSAYQISPPFPSTWPLKVEASLFSYVYAYGNDRAEPVVDGQIHSAPWARIRRPIASGSQPTVEILQNQLREAGLQGFRPLSDSELDIYRRGPSIENYLQQLNALPAETDPAAQELRLYYCTWKGHQGIIANQIYADHRSFFEWLKCGQPTRI